MPGYKLFTKYILGIFLIASISTHAITARGASNTGIHTIQATGAALPVSDWEQVNSNGFGDLQELEVSALESFNGSLYAGTYNLTDPLVLFDGARIYRSTDGSTWSSVTQPGFQNPHDSAPPAITDFAVFGSRLYASTGWGGNPAQIWRSSNGSSWSPMVTAGFGDPDIHNIPALVVYNSVIYAGAGSEVSGARIYRSTTGDSNTWTLVAPAASTMAGASVTGFQIFSSALYATVESEAPVQIWRTTNGTTWTSIMNNGFGNSSTVQTGGMAVFGGYLYVGAGNTGSGAQLWRTNDGTNWTEAITPAFGDANNKKVESVFVFQNQIYVSVKNAVTGIEVWRSADGDIWEQANLDGFGDSHNTGSNRGAATAEFLNHLYYGTANVLDGGELWRKVNPNNPPTDISLSNNSVAENQPVNTVVGTLSATDPDAGDTFIFSMACAVPGADDGSFKILGTDLVTSAVFDFQIKSVYNLCLRVTDQGGLSFDKGFTVNVIDLVTPPGAFSKLDPSNGVTGVSTSPLLSWQASTGASSYEYCYDTSNNASCDTSWTSTASNTSVSLSALPTGKVIYWQVRAQNFDGTTYADDAWWSFTTVPTFADVPYGHWAFSYIERLYASKITIGCLKDPLRYCPENPVLRSEMAVFIERGLNGGNYTPPTGTGTVFADVPFSYWAVDWIEKLFADGITIGCLPSPTPPRYYCPGDPVKRSEMAVFLLRTKYGSTFNPPPAKGIFSDVPTSYWAAAWIEKLYADGITIGCLQSPLSYCPEYQVTRAEMAAFLTRTFNLP